MDDIAEALAQGASTARLRALLDSEMAHGRHELAQKRSGYDRPVLVAVAPGEGVLRAVAPAAPGLRADLDAVNERTWLLVAALVGALVESSGSAELRAGALGEHLILELPADPDDAELVPLAFEGHVEPIDRLRARARILPGAVLAEATDLRAPIGPAHPLVVASRVAALGGHPADPASMEEHEDEVLAALEAADGPAVARPHDDPEPARRVARRILQRLDGMGKWGGYHTEFKHLPRGFAGNDRALAEAVGEALLSSGLLAEKPSVGQRHVFLNPRRAADIRALIERGETPKDLRLPD
jgi:hypothetical protein